MNIKTLDYQMHVTVLNSHMNPNVHVIVQNSHMHSPALLGDAPHRPTSPPIFLHHLCIFLLIVASPRRSALAALTPESDDHVTSHSYHLFTIPHLFHHFIILTLIFGI